MAKQRIGILGGSFDPVHRGHFEMARAAAESAGLDFVLMMPTGAPSYKMCAAPADDRWKMLVAACRGDSLLVPCSMELDRTGPVYTAETLPMLRNQYPDSKLFWITGADAFLRMRQWKNASEIFRAFGILVCGRPGAVNAEELAAETESVRRAGGQVRSVTANISSFASSAIRKDLGEGRTPEGLDLCVREYIGCKGLYGLPGRVPESGAWLDRLFRALKPHRFAHSLAVADTARRMAARFGEDPLKAEKAGILHDCAKHIPLGEMQKIARRSHLDADDAFMSSTALLHSLVGAVMAQQEYGMTDPEILEAIAYHNTGHPGMSRLAMCVCLSDSIEPTRESYPMLERIRAVADRSLENALLLSLESTAEYVRKKGAFLHPRTRDTIAWLKTLI